MKRAVENGLYLLGGLIIGGAGAFVITTKVFGEKIRNEISETVAKHTRDEMEWAIKQKDLVIASKDDEIKDLKNKMANPVPKNPPKTETKNSLNDPNVTNINEAKASQYHSIISEHYDVGGANKAIVDDELELDEAIKHIPQDYPFPISSEAFNVTSDDLYRMDYRHVVLDYFAADNTLCMCGDANAQFDSDAFELYSPWEIITDPDNVVGRAWLKNLNLDNNGGTLKLIDGTYVNWGIDTANVRNDMLRIDFEINYDKGSYKEWVIDRGRL